MRRKIIIVVVIAGVVAGGFWLLKMRGGNEKEPELATVPVTRGTLRVTVSATGVLEPLTTVEVKSRSGGEISRIYVEAGDYVRAGELIAQIDPTQLEGQVGQARAQTEVSRARLAQAELNVQAQVQQTGASIEEARAALASSKARLAQAEAQLEQTRLTHKQEVVQAEAALAAAQARLAQARSQEEAQPRLSQADVAQAQAGLDRARQDLAVLEAGSRPEEIEQARARVREAQAVADNAASALQRQRNLLAKGFVSQQVVDDAQRADRTARAQLESARQSLALVEAGPRPEEIERARAAVRQAQASLETAQTNRVQVKLKQQEREAAEATVRQAEAARETALANANQIEVRAREVEAAGLSIEQAEAALERTEAGRQQDAARTRDIEIAAAELRRAQWQLEDVEYSFKHTAIVAPRDGVVLEKLAEEGTVIPAGTAALAQGTTIVTLADITEMYVLVNVDEIDIARLEVGMPAEIRVQTIPDRSIRGEIVKIFPEGRAEQNVVYFPVRVKVLDLLPALRPGMTADVTILAAEKENVLLVPDSAIDRSGGKTTVQVLIAEGAELEERPVEVGLTNWQQTEILSGLQEGETVVLPLGAAVGQNGAPGRPGQTTRGAMGMFRHGTR